MNSTLQPTKQDEKSELVDLSYDVFIIIKPGFLKKKKEVIKAFMDRGFVLVDIIERRLNKAQARKIYHIHREKGFFNELVDYMISGMSIGMVFRSPYADKKEVQRAVMAIKNEMRSDSKDVMRNVMHAADSEDNAIFESKIYFTK